MPVDIGRGPWAVPSEAIAVHKSARTTDLEVLDDALELKPL
jgi:hypothetical protein